LIAPSLRNVVVAGTVSFPSSWVVWKVVAHERSRKVDAAMPSIQRDPSDSAPPVSG
jgi:hypothetical protein